MGGIGIVIVTYNSGEHIGACLEAALRTDAEIVVVDNASSDDTVEQVTCRNVRLLANSTNRGFAAAVNQGIASLDTLYILLLNPDTILVSGIEAMRAACELPSSAGAGGQLLDALGRPQIGFMVRRFPTGGSLALEALMLNRLWPGNPINRRYRCLDLDYSVTFQAEQPAGAFLMIRRDVWRILSGFDEAYWPLWFEDVDFCRRVWNAGYRLYYVPEAVTIHTGAHSIAKISVEMRPLYWYGSFLRYTVRHFSPAVVRMVCMAVIVGSVMRMSIEALLNRSLKPLAAYAKVVRLAGRVLLYPSRGNAVVLTVPHV